MRTRENDRGAALIIAVLCMLILAIFAMSVAVLADLETRVGGNHKAAQQAFALAEAGLNHGRSILKDAATTGDFNAFVNSASARQLGIPAAGISLGSGHYWVRVDNDCATPGGGTWTPKFVPTDIQDAGGGCQDTTDTNETAVLTAWAETTDGAGRVIGRARVRAHYTIGNPWKHSCYDGDGQMCIDDAVGGCNTHPCVDPGDPQNPNGPGNGTLPVPQNIKCGTAGNGSYPPIPNGDIPADVLASGAITATAPCVIYPYYSWALYTPAPTRTWCPSVSGTNPGYEATNLCSAGGTSAWNLSDSTCTTVATAGKCHGMVFFGPGNNGPNGLATNANGNAGIAFASGGSSQAGCMGYQIQSSARPCYDGTPGAQPTSIVTYIMGKVTVGNGVEVHGTIVLHGNGQPGGGSSNADLFLTGTNRIESHLCTGGVGTCGYPLAILAYDPAPNDPDDPTPTTSTGQSIRLDASNASGDSRISGIIYTGGTADFGAVTVDGGIIAWDVNISTANTRITYNSTYGDAAPPPGDFTAPADTTSVYLYPATWVHCVNYANDYTAPTPCE